jgi:AraC family transcriptional regulator, transcriptional activator of pobA
MQYLTLPMSHTRRQNVDTVQLKEKGEPAKFVFRSMEEIESMQDPAQAMEPHRHNYYTIIWVRKGTGSHHIDFRSYTVKDDTIYFLTPEQVHHLQTNPGTKGYVLLFTPDFLHEHGLSQQWIENTGFFFRCDDMAPFTLTKEMDSHNLEHLVHHIRDEYLSRNDYYLDAIGSWLKLFLLECRRLSMMSDLPVEARTNTRAVMVKQFRDLLENHYQEWHKVADYARELHITPNYLNEVISVETGRSAKDFILNRIMLEAKRYAGFAELSAKEVAYTLGFEDPSHFSKLFRQQQNQSFSEFRDVIRKNYH